MVAATEIHFSVLPQFGIVRYAQGPRLPEESSMDPNAHGTLLEKREKGALTWRGPALMLFA